MLPRSTSAGPNETGPSNMHELVPVHSAGLPVPCRQARSRSRDGGFASRWRLPFWPAGGGGAYYWWQRLHPPLPPGIVYGNGRLEADEINIDTKYAARIAEILVDEGDLVKAGQVVARMDTRDLAASLKKSEAQVRQARRAVDEANANVVQQKTQVLLAKQEYRPRQLSGAKRLSDQGGHGSAATATGRRQRRAGRGKRCG